jgi:DNA-binding transcriptional ArsR family regulator
MKSKISERMDVDKLALVARKFGILYHPVRNEIIEMLIEHKVLKVNEILEKITIVPTDIMFQLKVLYEAGFISKKRIDKSKAYSINSGVIERIIEYSDYLYEIV